MNALSLKFYRKIEAHKIILVRNIDENYGKIYILYIINNK